MIKHNFMISSVAAGLLLVGTVFGSAAYAADTMTHNDTKMQYETDMKHCATMKGNDKDVCEKQVKDKHEQMKSDYKAATEKCDAMSGDAKDKCMNDAKMTHGK